MGVNKLLQNGILLTHPFDHVLSSQPIGLATKCVIATTKKKSPNNPLQPAAINRTDQGIFSSCSFARISATQVAFTNKAGVLGNAIDDRFQGGLGKGKELCERFCVHPLSIHRCEWTTVGGGVILHFLSFFNIRHTYQYCSLMNLQSAQTVFGLVFLISANQKGTMTCFPALNGSQNCLV